MSEATICSRCIYDTRVPKIEFDHDGVCNYCHMSDNLKDQYATGTKQGIETFLKIVDEVKAAGKGKQYDCVVGVSGGTDSSYMLHYCVQLGLRPIAVHYDNTWNSATATENIRKITKKLHIDLYTHVVDNKEMDDIFRSFFFADVPEIDAPTDLGFAETHYRAASKYGIQYVFEGHSFMEEGVSPLGTMYFDGMYIKDIHRRFGTLPIQTYPLMDFKAFMKWTIIKRIRKIRPYWYIAYSKAEAMDFLRKEYGWEYYGGHHLENRMSAFMHSCYLPRKFRIDQRNNSLSALARNDFIARDEALDRFRQIPHCEGELIEYFKKRLAISDEIYETVMNKPPKWFREYRTYKKTFERLKPFFYLLAKANLVPMSFYVKFCSKNEI